MNDGFEPLLLALAVFLATHLVPAFGPLRRALIAGLGERPYLIAYGTLSLLVIGWVGVEYAYAPYVELWPPSAPLRGLTLAVMPVSCLLTVGALTAPNPLSIGIGGKGYDPERPGILRVTRHPLIGALILWAAAHIPPNGDVAALLLFGPMLALALAGPRLLDAKRKASLGLAEWRRLASHTSQGHVVWREIGIGRFALALALYALLLWLHPHLIGVDPLAR